MRVTRGLVLVLALLAGARAAAAQELWPGATYDPAIPTIKSVLGHEPGEAISTARGTHDVSPALAAAAPDRTYLLRVRPHLGAPAAARHGHRHRRRDRRLAAAQDGPSAFRGPPHHLRRRRRSSRPRAPRRHLADATPCTATRSRRLTRRSWRAYHLLASKNDPVVDANPQDALVLNRSARKPTPDGRSRFVSMNGLGQAATPDSDASSAEHDEGWPSGRIEPLPLRHEPRLVFALTARDARAANGSCSSTSRRWWSTCTRWAATARTTSRRPRIR